MGTGAREILISAVNFYFQEIGVGTGAREILISAVNFHFQL